MPSKKELREAPHLSVVVASYNSPVTLEACLASLTAQLGPGAEVIVADCSTDDPRAKFRRSFSDVKFLRFEQKLTIPELRREAIKISRGEIVALTEGRVVPSKQWAATLCVAHSTHPNAPAVGGPLDHKPTSAFPEAVFFCEYGRHMAPVPDGEASELTGANLSYKRWALELCKDLIESGAWEPFLHWRLEQHGHKLLRAGAALAWYRNSLTPGQFVRQRFHYGRWFAAARFPGARRILYALFCPALPFLMTSRLAVIAVQRGRGRRFLRALVWILFFQTIWSAGEFCGYVFGNGTSDRQVF